MEEIRAMDLNSMDVDSSERRCIAVWLDLEYKKKYDRVQDLSGQKFSKLLKKLVKQAIDAADV